MQFGEKLRLVRMDRGLTQEQLAELLSVSRQAVSKWESDVGYPETEKLLQLSKELNVSLDYLLLDESILVEKQKEEPREFVQIPQGRILITSFDGKQIVPCISVRINTIMFAGKEYPKYILAGVDHVSFFGDHSKLLAYYESREDAEKEVAAIANAMLNGDKEYHLQYQAEVEVSKFLEIAKLKSKKAQ